MYISSRVFVIYYCLLPCHFQICGGSFKKGRGLRIHLSKSRAGCKNILEIRMNKSKTGSSQEQHHSGPTSNIIPDTAAASYKGAPEQTEMEMWSIFSIYPETLSQCVGRKLKELRLEAASIALHDHVELEVKTSSCSASASRPVLLVLIS